jgi:hypothetical protein
MKIMAQLALAATLGAVLCAAPRPLAAQEAGYQNAISANPFGLLLEFFNAEYERAVSQSSTLGIGGSTASFENEDSMEDQRYFNADVFFRYYPSGNVFEGWNFGVKGGVTNLDSGAYPGFGFDVNRTWLLGASGNFYVSLGFGLKRLVGDVPDGEIDVIPTFRIVNVGFAF